MSLFSEQQLGEWNSGTLSNGHDFLGSHCSEDSTTFAVWAPKAKAVSAVGDFNDWKPQKNPLKKDTATGIWQGQVSKAAPGDCYKFHITPANGTPFLKADPFGFYHENGSQHASVIYPIPDYNWRDDQWLDERPSRHQPNQPLAIYEVHAGSWKKKPSGQPLSYLGLANQLIPYVKELGFTHIELMPIMEHPYGASWGYQITGYFAPTARYGRPEELMQFVDACHRAGIGVILDWVPGHFPRDEHGLAFFDGTPLYEHDDKRRREHPDWGTHNFDFDKPGVRNFMISNAFFWCEKYHIDGLRVDAVASMLYLDYSKPNGDWMPNIYGGNQNLGAVAFLQDLNHLLGRHHPGVLTIAEESTAWPGVTQAVSEGGLGFDYKWNMGWMNDTLHYFKTPAQQRPNEQQAITFPLTYAFDEQFILPFSHDEVVHLKKSLWSKMPGLNAQKYDQLKLLLLYMMGYPGKKLLFMGAEWAEKKEWAESQSLDWSLVEEPTHKEIQQFLERLLRMYKSEPALHRSDTTESGFIWNDLAKNNSAVFSFSRQQAANEPRLLFVFNFLNKKITNYEIRNFEHKEAELIINTRSSTPVGQVSSPVSLAPFQGIVLKETANN